MELEGGGGAGGEARQRRYFTIYPTRVGGYLFIFNITILKNQIRKCKSLGKITGSPGSSMSYGL